jgi:S1-C subfamily serine protease
MKLSTLITIIALSAPVVGAPSAHAQIAPETARKIHDQVSESLVVVQFTWASEVRKLELSAAGVVVGADGLIMASLASFNPQFPDEQLTDFKIIIPHADRDEEEVEAEFAGRDERYGVAYVRATGKHDWKPLKFQSQEPKVGDTVLSVGLLPKAGGFRSYLTRGMVSARLPDATPQFLVLDALAPLQSPVLNEKGEAIGIVSSMPGQPPYLSMGQREYDERSQLTSIQNPPRFFVPASEFLPSIAEAPKVGEPIKLSFMGVRDMKGLTKDVAEYYNIANQPAIQLGDVIPGTPAAEAGLKRGAIITKLNGKPLERGSSVEDLPGIFARNLSRTDVGEKVTLTVLPGRDEPTKDVVVTMAERPKRANLAERYYAEDLGFGVRELVFDDIYERQLKPEEKGVALTIVRPQSAAETARMQGNEMITQLNGKPVKDLETFKEVYEAFRKDKPKEAVVLVVKREGREDTVRIEPPQ